MLGDAISDLSSNRLNGSLPTSVGRLVSIRTLWVGQLRLSYVAGLLHRISCKALSLRPSPTSAVWSFCLTYVNGSSLGSDLSDNQISGACPDALTTLLGLETLCAVVLME